MSRSENRPAIPPASALEVFCRVVLVGTGLFLALSAGLIVGGGVFPPTEGLLAALFADELLLPWITLVSFVHLAFVPALCIAVAMRDARLQSVGFPVPMPRSTWKGDDSVFLDKEAA